MAMKEAFDLEVGDTFVWDGKVYIVNFVPDEASKKMIVSSIASLIMGRWTRNHFINQEDFNSYCQVEPVSYTEEIKVTSL